MIDAETAQRWSRSGSTGPDLFNTERFKGTDIHANAQMGTKGIKEHCALDEEGKKLLELAVERLGLSARAYTRILKVARTIADLDGKENISSPSYIRGYTVQNT